MVHAPITWIAAALLATLVAGVAYRMDSLSRSGALAAIILGTLIVGTGGWWPGAILVAFFATSSLISTSESSTGAKRNWLQVVANGWALLLGCSLYAITQWEPWLLFGIGAVAAATADTWSSEIGRRSATPPRLVTTWRSVEPGTSGAVSPLGMVMTLAGASFIGLLAAIAVATNSLDLSTSAIYIFFGITLAGIAGGMLDSLLGATVQEQRWCNTCARVTESNPHRCGDQSRYVRGIRGFNNDVVNALCSLAGALIGLVSGIL